jgi:hypothetical protein
MHSPELTRALATATALQRVVVMMVGKMSQATREPCRLHTFHLFHLATWPHAALSARRMLRARMVQCSRGARTNNGPCDLLGADKQGTRGTQHNPCRLVLHTRTHTHTHPSAASPCESPTRSHTAADLGPHAWLDTSSASPRSENSPSSLVFFCCWLLVEVTEQTPTHPPHMHPLPFPSPGRSDGAVGCERTTHPRCA